MKFNKLNVLVKLDHIESIITGREFTLDQSTTIHHYLQDLQERIELYIDKHEIPLTQ